MRPKHRQFLSCVLLAAYASISLIGDGLHELLPDGHHHHHGLYVVGHNCGDPQHPDHAHQQVACCGSEFAGLTAVDSDAESHLCEICSFLYHAVSQPAEVAAPIDWQPLVVAAYAKPQASYSPIFPLGLHAPRGPPLFLA